MVVLAALYIDFSRLNPFREKQYFSLVDQCGIIPGGVNLMHTVNNEEECDIQCLGRCESLKLKKVKSVFTEAEAGCHDCSCVCR